MAARLQLRGPGAARVDDRAGRYEAKVRAKAEHTPLVAFHAQRGASIDEHAACLASGYQCAPETAIIHATFTAHDQSAGDVRTQPRLGGKQLMFGRAFPWGRCALRAPARGVVAARRSASLKAAWTTPSRRRCGSIPLAARTRSTNAGYSRNEEAQNSSSASSRTRSVYGASIPAPGPRGRARRLGHDRIRVPSRHARAKLEGNRQADEPGADYDDVAATVIHRKQRFDAARGSPALRPLPTCRCRRDPRRLAGEPR